MSNLNSNENQDGVSNGSRPKIPLKERLRLFWTGINPHAKKIIVLCCAGFLLISIAVAGWVQMTNKPKPKPPAAPRSELKLDAKVLEHSQMAEKEVQIRGLNEAIADMRAGKTVEFDKQGRPISGNIVGGDSGVSLPGAAITGGNVIPNQKTALGVILPVQPAGGTPINVDKKPSAADALFKGITPDKNMASPGQNHGAAEGNSNKKSSSSNKSILPPLPPLPSLPSSAGPAGSANGFGQAEPPQMVSEVELGDISVVSNDHPVAVKSAPKKKVQRSVYLPPSFMEATLLSGLDAPTSEMGKGNPVPVLLRIKAPAVLPNEIKANLKGCFVIADGKGNLATERAELTLVSLSCLDRKGQAVIDQRIKGWIVDQDGKVGLQGRVVAKMGAAIARSLIAGFFGGAGEALKTSGTSTALSAIGSVQTINPSEIGKNALGSGLSTGFKDIQKFYLDLAKQTMPVIEVGASKSVTLVIGEGVNLPFKKLSGGGL